MQLQVKKLQVEIEAKKYEKLKETLTKRGQTISGWLRFEVEKTLEENNSSLTK